MVCKEHAPKANLKLGHILENVEHCGGEPEQAANWFDMGFVTSK